MIYAHVLRGPPVEDWAKPLADIFQAARSSQDHAVYGLATKHAQATLQGKAVRRPTFPLYLKKGDFTRAIKGALADLPPELQKVIADVQPFEAFREHAALGVDVLYALHDLNAQDKHREPSVPYVRQNGYRWSICPNSLAPKVGIKSEVLGKIPVQDGTPLARYILEYACPQAHIIGDPDLWPVIDVVDAKGNDYSVPLVPFRLGSASGCRRHPEEADDGGRQARPQARSFVARAPDGSSRCARRAPRA
jgi:hypothetical protein